MPKKLKCQYILDEIEFVEKEKDKLLNLLEKDSSEDETIKTIVKLKKLDMYLDKLRKLATNLICEI